MHVNVWLFGDIKEGICGLKKKREKGDVPYQKGCIIMCVIDSLVFGCKCE